MTTTSTRGVIVRSTNGFTIVELVFATGLLTVVAAAAAPPLLAGLDEWRTSGAARYIASRLYQARMEAAVRRADTAIRFERIGTEYQYSTLVDGNRNGIRGVDVATGLDRPIQPAEQLADKFPGVQFGALAGLPSVDPYGTPPGSDPIRLGTNDTVTFTPLGSSTPGSVYIRGRGSVQYVVRVFAETGKIRVLKFQVASRQWTQL
jgi:type II secretory pathway pseudopilin PulG